MPDIRKGAQRVEYHKDSQFCLESRSLEAGDLILLIMSGQDYRIREVLATVAVMQSSLPVMMPTRFNLAGGQGRAIREHHE
jgi:hypothetical protein